MPPIIVVYQDRQEPFDDGDCEMSSMLREISLSLQKDEDHVHARPRLRLYVRPGDSPVFAALLQIGDGNGRLHCMHEQKWGIIQPTSSLASCRLPCATSDIEANAVVRLTLSSLSH